MEKKEIQFTKSIFLRKILRARNNSLGRIPLLVFKYEILSNLCFYERIRQISYDESQDQTFPGHTSAIQSLAVSPDNKFIISGSGYPENSIKIWNFKEGTLLRILTGHSYDVLSVVISSDMK